MQNVFLLTIDCLRYDYFGDLMNIIKENFTNCCVLQNLYSTSSWTTPSFYSLFSASYPFEDGGFLPFPPSQLSLADIMRKNGFTTCGIHSNYYLSSIFNYDKGFDYFYDLRYQMFLEKEILNIRSLLKKILGKIVKLIDKLAFLLKIDALFIAIKNRQQEKARSKGIYHFARDASVITKKAIKFLKKHKKGKKFVWLHYMDLHYPLKNPEGSGIDLSIKELNSINDKIRLLISQKNETQAIPDREKEIWRQLYAKNIKFVGNQINYLFNKIKEFKVENPIIIITSDHGELLFEHGMVFHGITLYDENIHIPCMIWKESFNQEKTITNLCSNVDFIPTIMDLCNINHEKLPHGSSIFDKANRHRYIVAYTDSVRRLTLGNHDKLEFEKYCLRTEKWKYIIDKINRQEFLFDLTNDPREINNLIDSCNQEIKDFFNIEMKKILEPRHDHEILKLKNATRLISTNSKL
ncbi:MAG TPA: sulfatase-like hydrolase/transferase [Candidatus Lokiarchaeia archaeon]|nr:sulfatase-like hydrolase/transferase [Candidatus Lokiarchaeia archaeon]